MVFAALLAGGAGLAFYLVPPLLGLPGAGPNAIGVLVTTFPLAVAIAVLRHALFDIDVLLNPTLVYGLLTFGVVTAYAAIVAVAGAALPAKEGALPALLVAAIAAVLVQPLRDRIQWVASRRLVRRALRRTGALPADPPRREVGREVGRARGRARIARGGTPSLRRDLHDGIGPTLGGLAMRLDAVSNVLGRQNASARTLLLELREQVEGAIIELRRLVHALRPPALDDLGLVAALREHVERAQSDRLMATVVAGDHLTIVVDDDGVGVDVAGGRG